MVIMFLLVGANWLICTKQMYMKPLYALLIILAGAVAACTTATRKNDGATDGAEHNTSSQLLIGSYVGAFGANKITLLITKVFNDSVEGRTIVGGNDRPFSGMAQWSDNKLNVVAAEPGDDINDGTFKFTFDKSLPDMLSGSWKPFREQAGVSEKQYELKRRTFKYLKDAGDYPESSLKLLSEDDVANLSKEELELMRNEIFARHGYCFKKKTLRATFENADWYVPNTADVTKDLTPIEKKNIALIKRYENYAESFGDDFGR